MLGHDQEFDNSRRSPKKVSLVAINLHMAFSASFLPIKALYIKLMANTLIIWRLKVSNHHLKWATP